MTISYHVQHSPMGAFSSFALGHFGSKGGLATQVGRPGSSNVFVGYQDEKDEIHYLPFFEGAKDNRSDFEIEAHGDPGPNRPPRFSILKEEEIRRTLNWATDEWVSGPLSLKVYSPFFEIPDPSKGTELEMKRASCPVVFARITLDNSAGTKAMKGIFALDGHRMRDLESTSNGQLCGIASLNQYGFGCHPTPNAAAFMEFNAQDGFVHAFKRNFRLGKTGGMIFKAEPKRKEEWIIALGFFNPGIVTTGIETSYWYARYFNSLESILQFGLENWDFYRDQSNARDKELSSAKLNPEQKFMIAHATHSYYGSTQWLDRGGKPIWVVNEGEYEMINTFDLTVDQIFYEMRFSPWTVRNELEFFVERYSYYDQVHKPGQEGTLHEGGLSFCHDQGISNQFTPPTHSSYELTDLPGKCFSYMTHEQLCNWICCAGVYYSKTSDMDFLKRHRGILADCYTSLVNRDDPDPEKRNGIMGLDSSRTGMGAEITTYDSLDASLGQARNNLYLAGKIWASYVILENLFMELGQDRLAERSRSGAARCAASICSQWNDTLGFIPAVFEDGNASAIIPAIEGLVYPHYMGLSAALNPKGPYGEYLKILKKHFLAVFKKGVCQFPDNGWKLSSTSNNSWMSKIAISQHVARSVLGINFGEEQLAHDMAHADWQRVGSGFWACSDQFVSGKAMGSRYYPRIVTSILWMDE